MGLTLSFDARGTPHLNEMRSRSACQTWNRTQVLSGESIEKINSFTSLPGYLRQKPAKKPVIRGNSVFLTNAIRSPQVDHSATYSETRDTGIIRHRDYDTFIAGVDYR